MDEAAVQKRLWMIQVAEQFYAQNGLDLFAGVGYGTKIMYYSCENVFAIENNEKKYSILCKNLQGTGINIYCKDNLDF
jgi:tRNA G37 N-methylase Trm5